MGDLSSAAITNWVAGVTVVLLAFGFWRDIRKQTIAGSLPTEFTTTLVTRVAHLEDRLDKKDAEHELYRHNSRTWFYAAHRAIANGEPLPPPPNDWP